MRLSIEMLAKTFHFNLIFYKLAGSSLRLNNIQILKLSITTTKAISDKSKDNS